MTAPDYRTVLGIEPGRELQMFPCALLRVLSFAEMAPERSELDFLNEMYATLDPSGGRDFRTLLEGVWKSSGEHSSDDFSGWNATQLHNSDSAVRVLLMMDTRMRGSVDVPAAWTPDGLVAAFASKDTIGDPRHWWVYVREGISFYSGQDGPAFSALDEYAGSMFSDAETSEEAAFHLWDTVGQLRALQDLGGVIDALHLLDRLPRMHYRAGRTLEDYELLSSPSAGVRLAAASVLDRHPMRELLDRVKALLLDERVPMVAEAQVRALRLMGGDEGFDALAEVAHDAHLSSTADLSRRALAWVHNCPERQRRILDLCRSRVSKSRSIGSAALAESKYHSVFSYGGKLASKDEDEYRKCFIALMDGHSTDEQRGRLRSAFVEGAIFMAAGDRAIAAGVDEGGSVAVTKDGVVVLKLHQRNVARGREALRGVVTFPG